MKLIKCKIGELIEQINDVNSDLKYDENSAVGMTITKEIIPTKANLNGTDLSKFIIVRPESFIYNPRTHGKKIGFGYNNTKDTYIISWNNIAFKIKDDKKSSVLADYLFLHFRRDEWDREACYQSWGTSTEVFTWDALCDMDIELPSIDIQQKYVDIYNAMLSNQQSYECGLEDLKISFNALIDRYKHTSKRIPVKDILSEVDNRNSDGAITTLKGINISKQFMDSVANTTSVDLSKYKIVKNSQIAFSGMQTGRDKCIRIALSRYDYPIIISPAYTVFDITNHDMIPEYFMIWFSRFESDRYGWFISDSSIRSNLDLDRFYETEVPVPDKKIQESIVEIYKAYIDRRDINENLKQQIKDICPILIKGSIEEARKAGVV